VTKEELRASPFKGWIINIGLGFPGLAVAAYFAIGVYLVVPFREITHRLFPRSHLTQ
jgi:hypothetical protein